MNENEYRQKIANYKGGNAPLFDKGHTFIVPDIPAETNTHAGLYGRRPQTNVGKSLKIVRVGSKHGGQYSYRADDGWYYLESDIVDGSYPQLLLFQQEVYGGCKS
jgi:hypothetical protein